MATTDEIGQLWRILRATYDYFGRDRTPAEMALTLSVYEEMLSDVPCETLQRAAKQHIATSKFFPTIAELRQAALALTAPAGSERTALEAWGRVKRAFSDGSFYPYEDRLAAPDFSDDPILQSVVSDLGGMMALFESTNETADRARFLEAYEARQRRAAEERQRLPAPEPEHEKLTAGGNGRVAGLIGGLAGKLRPPDGRGPR